MSLSPSTGIMWIWQFDGVLLQQPLRTLSIVWRFRTRMIRTYGCKYDGRGHLSSLEEFEPRQGVWEEHFGSLDPEEAAEEQMAEEERWLSLNEYEEETREEILKRAAAPAENFAEIGFNYDNYDSQDSGDRKDDTVGVENRPDDFVDPDDKPYKVPKGLTLPVTVPRPETRREHTIIEKTAQFIARQGGQLEVVIRVKQKNNAQFAFLDIEHPLNLYYRYLVQQIKSGAYRPAVQDDNESGSDSDSDFDGGYLHPSLFASKGSSSKSSGPPEALKNIFKAQASKTKGTCAYSQLIDKIRPSIELDQEASNGPTAVENVGSVESASNGDSNGTPAREELADTEIVSGTGIAEDTTPQGDSAGADSVVVGFEALVAVMPPPPDVQPIVDKMAEYVAKNGLDFEESIRAKGDPKFSFVDLGNEFYEYYQFKVKEFSLTLNESTGKASAKSDQETTALPVSTDKPVKVSKSPNALERIALENSLHTSPERTPKERRVEKKKMKISLKCQENGGDKKKEQTSSGVSTAPSNGETTSMIGPLLPSLYDDEDVEVREDILEELSKAEKRALLTAVVNNTNRKTENIADDKKGDTGDMSKERRQSESVEKRKNTDKDKSRDKSHHKGERSRNDEKYQRSSRERQRERGDKSREKDKRRCIDEVSPDAHNTDTSNLSRMKNGGSGSSRSERGDGDDELKRKQLERKKKLAAFLTMVKEKDGAGYSDKKEDMVQTDLKAKIRHLKRAMADSDEEPALGEADSRRPPDERVVKVPVIKVSKEKEEPRHAKMNLKKLRKETLEEGELVENRTYDSGDDSYERRRRRSRDRKRRISSSSKSRSSSSDREYSRSRRRHHKHHKSKSSRRNRD
ncbi:splicing factor, suppressor of white-apricot homolog isoform X2 [Varroa jacobsoni]|nr:splicing factor, suppressor of white-apricot homolog isoform X2 [Varroa jacobsoni]